MEKPPPATFAGYVSEAGNPLVQEWYDGLCDEDRDEISDQCNYLASMPVTEWKRPEFDKVTPPLAEIRCKSNKTNHAIRLYGWFDPAIRARFIILNATEAKNKSNDSHGQQVALDRLASLKTGKASSYGFAFQGRAPEPGKAEQGSKDSARVLEFRQGYRKPNSRNQS